MQEPVDILFLLSPVNRNNSNRCIDPKRGKKNPVWILFWAARVLQSNLGVGNEVEFRILGVTWVDITFGGFLCSSVSYTGLYHSGAWCFPSKM